MNITQICAEIAGGKLMREIDEKGAGGFWDYAGNIVDEEASAITEAQYERLQQEIYNALWEVFEVCNP